MNAPSPTAIEILCPYCNAPNPERIPYCITCGTPLEGSSLTTGVAPFVGRHALLEQLQQDVETVRRLRRGRFVVVEGEGGIGKSRLARELIVSLWNGEQRVLTGRAYSDKQSTSYWLLSDILFHFFRLEPEMSTEQRRGQIQDSLLELFGPVNALRTTPPLLWLFDLATESEQQEMESLEPEQRQQRLFRAVQALYLTAGAQQPLVLIVDDAQWADALSMDFLARLLDKRLLLRLLVIMFARPNTNGQERPLDRLMTATPPDMLYPVQPLGDEAALAALSGILNGGEVPLGLDNLLLPRAHGVPFLLEELTRTLIERGVVFEEEGRWQYDPKRGLTGMLLPLTAEATLRERLSHLTEAARLLLEVASVMGTRQERAVLLTATSLLGQGWVIADLEAALSTLGVRGFLLGEDGDRFRFRHDLTQEMIVAGLADGQRTRYHEAIAQGLEQLYQHQPLSVVERLALHYGQSNNVDRALYYLQKVGELAAGHFAAEQARFYFHNALQRFADEMAAHPELFLTYGNLLVATAHYEEAHEIYELGLGMVDPSYAAQFYCQIGIMYTRQAKYNEAEQSFTFALKRVNPSDEPMRAVLFSEMGRVRFQQGRLDEAEELFEEALAFYGYEQAQERAQILNRMAGVAFRRGQLDKAHKILTRVMDALAEAGDLLGMAKAYNNLGSIYSSQGDFENGILHRQQALQLFERLGDTEGQSAALSNLAALYADLGRFDEAYPLAEQGLELARESGQQYRECFALYTLGWIRAHQQDLLLAREWLSESREIAQAIGASHHLYESTIHLAEVLLYGGWVEEAGLLVQELTRTDQVVQFASYLWRLQAELARHEGNLDGAARSIQISLEFMDQEYQAPLSKLLSQAEHVAILDAQGNIEERDAEREKALQAWQSINPNTPVPWPAAKKLKLT